MEFVCYSLLWECTHVWDGWELSLLMTFYPVIFQGYRCHLSAGYAGQTSHLLGTEEKEDYSSASLRCIEQCEIEPEPYS